MSLFSFLRKNKQETAADGGAFSSRAETESQTLRGRGKRKSSQSEEAVDPVLPEKKRARRRLVGAIALVLAAVIGLPMIFDTDPKPLSDDIAIQIPSKEKSLQIAPVEAPVASSTSVVQPSEQIAEPVEAAKPAAEHAVKAEAKAEKIVEKPVEKKSEKLAVTAETKPAKHDAKPETKPTPHSDDGARALALLEGKSEAAADKKPATGKYAVQVAALATQEKINELRGKLSAAGIQSYTQKVATASGERTRIRVGPFATREEAEKMRSKLVKMGLNGTLVPPPNS
ncbi:MAG: SPOR domain-containing protein [Proteobacteria bacterium]|nr:SPOR domain-containing protein [Pseudomonadota bacterium]